LSVAALDGRHLLGDHAQVFLQVGNELTDFVFQALDLEFDRHLLGSAFARLLQGGAGIAADLGHGDNSQDGSHKSGRQEELSDTPAAHDVDPFLSDNSNTNGKAWRVVPPLLITSPGMVGDFGKIAGREMKIVAGRRSTASYCWSRRWRCDSPILVSPFG